MSDLRTAAQQALEALEDFGMKHYENTGEVLHRDVYEALRAALAQQDEPEAYGYASRLAVAIWEKHYKDTAPQWKLLDDLMGVLTQIDNMTSGLTRLAQQAEPVEPVATLTAQRDALLEALRALVRNEGLDAYSYLDKGIGTATAAGQRWLNARAAIKAVEETK